MGVVALTPRRSHALVARVAPAQDKDGKQGVRLSRKIMVVAGDALRSNMTRLGPKVLPVIEQAKFLLNLVGRKMTTGSLPLPRRTCP